MLKKPPKTIEFKTTHIFRSIDGQTDTSTAPDTPTQTPRQTLTGNQCYAERECQYKPKVRQRDPRQRVAQRKGSTSQPKESNEYLDILNFTANDGKKPEHWSQ